MSCNCAEARFEDPACPVHGPDAGPQTLECNHCGGVAIEEGELGLFYDGEGDKCMTCGYPGHVVVWEDVGADDAGPEWRIDDEGVCADKSCSECFERRSPQAMNETKEDGR